MARMHDCQNLMKEGRCDEWIMKTFRTEESAGMEDHEMEKSLERADAICSACAQFLERKAAPEQHSGTHQLLKKGKLVIS